MKKLLNLVLIMMLLLSGAVLAEEDENIALGKPVTAQSYIKGMDPEKIVDGNLKTNWARSEVVTGAWIQVDLKEAYRITSVVLHTRLDVNETNYRTYVNLQFSNTPDFSGDDVITVQAMGAVPAEYGVPVEVNITSKKSYRYVRAVKTDMFIFVLAEMEVYGYIGSDSEKLELADDVKNSRCQGAVTVLQTLGLMDNINDNEFGVNNLVTRGEAASLVSSVFAPGSTGGKMPFEDVDAGCLYYDGIAAAYANGFIKLDTMFNPDNYITTNEMIIMVLRAIGYEPKLKANYLPRMLANELGLLKNTSGLNEVSRADAAIIIYNALCTNRFEEKSINKENTLYEKGDTTLESVYDMILSEGIVTENSKSTLSGAKKKIKNQIKIGTKAYFDTDDLLGDYLGRNVVFGVFKDNPEKISVVFENDKNGEVVLPADLLKTKESDIASHKIRTENESYSLSGGFDVIYNGMAYPNFTAKDLININGELRLLDNNADGEYEAVFIKNFELIRLNGAYVEDNEKIILLDRLGNRISLDKENCTIENTEHKKTSVSKLGANKVVKLYASKDKTQSKIVVMTESASGRLEMLSDSEAKIDGKSFETADKISIESGVYVQTAVTAYSDENGKLICILKNDDAENSEWIVGFLQKVGSDDKLGGEKLQFKIFTSDGEWKKYMAADKVKTDGKMLDISGLYARISEKREYFTKNLIRFKLNNEGKIYAVDTLLENLDGDTFFSEGKLIKAGLYSKQSSAFWEMHKMICPAKNDVPSFSIPTVNGEFTDDDKYDDLYMVGDLTFLAEDRSYKLNHNIHQFMVDEYGYAGCYMKTRDYAEIEGETLTVVSDETAPFAVVKNAFPYSEGDFYGIKIDGYDIKTAKEVSFIVEDDVKVVESGLIYQEMSKCLGNHKMIELGELLNLSDSEKSRYISSITDIGSGDIVRYELIGNGKKSRALERVFTYDNEHTAVQQQSVWLAVNGNYPDHYIAFNRFQYAEITEITSKTVKLTMQNGNSEIYPIDAFSKILLCSNKKLTPKTSIIAYSGDKYRIMFYCDNASPKTAVVYEYKN